MTLAFPKPMPRPRQRKPLERGGRIKARLPRRLDSDEDDTPYRRFVVRLGFCVVADEPDATRCRGPIQPAHVTLSADEKGMGMKVPDRQCVPMCAHHHDCWDGRVRVEGAMFFGWTKPERYDRGAKWVEATQLAATPEDREQAIQFQADDLGRIEDLDGGAWRWVPGPPPKDEAT